MNSSIISFTDRGFVLAGRVAKCLTQTDGNVWTFTKQKEKREHPFYVKESLSDWTRQQFEQKRALYFIGAAGIAVRAVAGCLKDKLTDVPVLVLDEAGQFVIPILSGHYGGANERAEQLADWLGAQAVITTATDVNGLFAIDVFAKKQALTIANKCGIAVISSKILRKQTVTISIESQEDRPENLPQELTFVPYETKTNVDILISPHQPQSQPELWLIPKAVVLGVGCKKNTDAKQMEQFLQDILQKSMLDVRAIKAVASIDQKQDEPCILQFCEQYHLPFQTFCPEELEQVEGTFSSSSFVKQTVGVDNVCERAACLAAGRRSTLLQKKQAKDGMTAAIAKTDWRVQF
ncbi:MAG: cobalt-precorrin 5A hydrolase [Lachnospiraceae bacterium]